MIKYKNIEKDLNNLQTKAPLILNITNFVATNFTANALLSLGASPIMAHAVEEIEEITEKSSALLINIGTLDSSWVKSMYIASKKALEIGIPLIFDPVGIGSSVYRTEVCLKILENGNPKIIRGNASEIAVICELLSIPIKHKSKNRGVDTTLDTEDVIDAARELSLKIKSIIVVSGAIDYITDGKESFKIANGHQIMSKVTGMGCVATSVISAFSSVNSNYMEASLHAMLMMGIAGELAARRSPGNGSMQINFLDELYQINSDKIKENIKLL